MLPVKLVPRNAEALKFLWEKFDAFRDLFSAELPIDPIEFTCWIAAEDTQVFAVGADDGKPHGVFIFTNISPKAAADVHIFMWDREGYEYKELVKSAKVICKAVMEAHDLRRLNGLTPVTHVPARAFAEAVGFKIEGEVRKAVPYHGEWVNGWISGLLREEADAFAVEPDKL